MIGLYKELQEIKQFVIDKLDKLETFKTFVQTDTGYKVTGPEGYVLHKDGDMIKFVNRLEFHTITLLLQKMALVQNDVILLLVGFNHLLQDIKRTLMQ